MSRGGWGGCPGEGWAGMWVWLARPPCACRHCGKLEGMRRERVDEGRVGSRSHRGGNKRGDEGWRGETVVEEKKG